MSNRIVLVHTLPPLVDIFTKLCAEILPGVQEFHAVDELILEYVRLGGGLDREVTNRLTIHVVMYEHRGNYL